MRLHLSSEYQRITFEDNMRPIPPFSKVAASAKAKASPTRGSIVPNRSMYAIQRELQESLTDTAMQDPDEQIVTSALSFNQPG